MPPSATSAEDRCSGDRLTTYGLCIVLLSTLSIGCVIPISSTPNPTDAGSPDGSTGGPGAPDAAVPTGKWTNATGSLVNMPSVCDPVPYISVKPDEDVLIANVAGVGLWASRDGGDWQELGTGTGSAKVTNRLTSIVYDPKNSARYWESGIYGPAIFETMDDGKTFITLGTVAHSDLLSVDLTDPNRQTMLLGGHEQPKTLHRSTDGGMTWSDISSALPATPYCTLPLIVDARTYLVGCYGAGPTGVYRTTDGAATWQRVTTSGGAAAPLVASDKSIYWTSQNGAALTRSKTTAKPGRTWAVPVSSRARHRLSFLVVDSPRWELSTS